MEQSCNMLGYTSGTGYSIFEKGCTACNEPIERLYCSANFDDICIYCDGDVPTYACSNTEEFYAQCEDCPDKFPIASAGPYPDPE